MGEVLDPREQAALQGELQKMMEQSGFGAGVDLAAQSEKFERLDPQALSPEQAAFLVQLHETVEVMANSAAENAVAKDVNLEIGATTEMPPLSFPESTPAAEVQKPRVDAAPEGVHNAIAPYSAEAGQLQQQIAALQVEEARAAVEAAAQQSSPSEQEARSGRVDRNPTPADVTPPAEPQGFIARWRKRLGGR